MPRKPKKTAAPPPSPAPPAPTPLEIQQQAQVCEWNANYPPGTKVRIRRNIGLDEETETISVAEVAGCPVVHVGCRDMPVALKRLMPL